VQGDLQSWIGKRIEDLREVRGVSAREMSRGINKEETYIRQMETGKSTPSIATLYSICEYLNISLKDFFDDEVENPEALNNVIGLLRTLGRRELDCITNMAELLTEKKGN
jgi:transcriptional regulator with XRE-family HTH domain